MGSWLSWKVGNGKQVILGTDSILGSDEIFIFSSALISILSENGFKTLEHIERPDWMNRAHSYCLTAEDLGLKGSIADEWKAHIDGLRIAGIRLTEDEDKLIWSWNKSNGQLNAKSAYDAISIISSDYVGN